MEMEWDRNEMENMYLKSQESADSYWILISLQNIFSHRRVIVLSSSIMPNEKIYIPSFQVRHGVSGSIVSGHLHCDNCFENQKKDMQL